MEKEFWKPSSTYPTHEASNLGRIRRIPFEGVMPHGGKRMYGGKPTYGAWSKEDNRYVILVGPSPVRTLRVARIVCDAFHGPPPPEAVCMHLDENSRNNRPENLAWGSQRENLNADGFKRNACFHPRRLTEEQVREIRQSPERPCDLARKFGVKACTVSNIRAGRMRTSVK